MRLGFALLAGLLLAGHFVAATDFQIRGSEVVALDSAGIEIGTLPLEGNPESLALSPDRSTVYVRLADENSIAVFDARTLLLTGWYSLDRVVGGTKLDPKYWSVDPKSGRLVFRTLEGKPVFADEFRDAARAAQAPAPAPPDMAASADFDLSALSGAKDSPSADYDANGNFAATWTDLAGHDGSGEGVYIREFDGSGNPQAAEFNGNRSKSGDQGNSTLASASNGDYVVVWRDSSGQDGDRFGVFGRRFSNGGAPKDSHDITIPNTTSGNQKEPSLDVQPDGEFVAVWVGPSGGNKAVFARRFNADGSAKAGEQVIAQSDSENAPDVATNSTGRFVVVWRDGTDDQVRARVYNSSGNPVGGAFKVDSSPNNQFAPTVAMNENGDFTVAWQTNAAGGILYRQFSADGNPNGGTRSAGTGGDKDYAPSLSMNGDGLFCIAWRDDLLNVWARQFQGNGDPIDDAFKASQSGGDQLEPTCAIDPGGNFLVAWKYRPGSGDGSIRGRLFNSGAPPGLSVTCTADPTEGLPPLAVSFTAQASGGNGSYSYAWDFDDGGTSSDQNPSHTYTTSGTYKAKVTATSGTDTATCRQTISVGTASSVVVNELTVTSVNRNTPETILSVKGSGFQDGATVSFNDPDVIVFVTNWIDSTRIKVRINVLSTAFLGLHDVTVVNPDQTQGTGPELLKVLQNGKYPAPSILTVDPSSVAAGSTPVLKITGADFARDSQALAVDAGAAITIDTIDWISATEIHAHANVSPDAVCGVHDVVVSNGSASSQPCAGCLSVTSSGGLSIGQVKPASLHVGEGPVDVTISGCGFNSNTVAKIKGTKKNSQTFVDGTTLILNITVKPDTDPGFKRVIVKNSSTIKKRKDLFQVKP